MNILKGTSLGDRMDPYANLGRCRDPCPTWWSHGSSLQSGSWSHRSVSPHDCQAERYLNFTGDEARLIPDIEKRPINAFMFSDFTPFALLPNAIVSPIQASFLGRMIIHDAGESLILKGKQTNVPLSSGLGIP